MCILDINAAKKTATAVQAVGHNLDTVRGDLTMLHTMLVKRGHIEQAERIRLVMFHMEREADRIWNTWSDFVQAEKDCTNEPSELIAKRDVSDLITHRDTWGYGSDS